MNERYLMPALALRGIVVFPNSTVGFDVIREKSVKALDEAASKDNIIFLVTQKDVNIENPTELDLYKVGTIARIKKVMKLPGGAVHTVVEGLERAHLLGVEYWNPHIAAGVEPFKPLDGEVDNPISTQSFARTLQMQSENFLEFNRRFPIDLIAGATERGDLEALTDIIGAYLGCSYTV